MARNAVLGAGFPATVPGTTIDRQCGSSQPAASGSLRRCCEVARAASDTVLVALVCDEGPFATHRRQVVTWLRINNWSAGAGPKKGLNLSTTQDKKDPAVTIQAADRLLETTDNPLHRQILENYRRHAILEITGEWEGIFESDMTVEQPFYSFDITGWEGVILEGAEAVKELYSKMAEDLNTVIVLEDEQLMVSDWGFASEATFNTYLRGRHLLARGIDADDPEGYYNLRQRFAMIWPYDDRGRMIGEHVYEAKAFFEVVTLEADEYVTVEDARAGLLPMLRPLPKFDPSGSNLRR